MLQQIARSSANYCDMVDRLVEAHSIPQNRDRAAEISLAFRALQAYNKPTLNPTNNGYHEASALVHSCA